jgi:hypothetical protein
LIAFYLAPWIAAAALPKFVYADSAAVDNALQSSNGNRLVAVHGNDHLAAV